MLKRLMQHGGGSSKILLFLVKMATLLSLACYFGAFGYGFYATMPDVIENTRVSESAFMPGHVRTRFDRGALLSNYAKGLRVAFKDGLQKAYIMNALQDMGLEAYNQSYQLNAAYSIPGMKTAGENVYGIIRTTKNPSVESMLMVVPLDQYRIEGAALALTIADYFKDQVYWARDIVFLFVDPSAVAMEAWLAAFNGYSINNLKADALFGRSGTIVGSYVFDLKGQNFDHIHLKFFGVNGRQPNLDLVNVAVAVFHQFGGTPLVNNLMPYHAQHEELMSAFIQSIYKQTFKEIDGLHSVFGSYGISAVSLVGKPSKKQYHSRMVDLTHMAVIVESCFRSLNNILEKLHQSYFLYYLLSPKKFMSVAFYMVLAAFFMVPMALLALREYLKRAGNVVPKALVYNHLLPLGLYFATVWTFSSHEIPENVREDLQKLVLIAGPIVVHLMSFLYPLRSNSEYISLKFILFLEVGILIGATSLLSISPGLVIGFAVVLPVILIANVFTMVPFLAVIGSLILHPLAVIFGSQFVLAQFKFEGFSELSKTENPLQLAAKWTCDGLRVSVHKHLVHSSMLFPIYCIFILAISAHLMSISRFRGDTTDFAAENGGNKDKKD